MNPREAFVERLVEAIVFRRSKTWQFVSDAELESLMDHCLAIWHNPSDEGVMDPLQRVLDNTSYLAAAGNWGAFVELLELSAERWEEAVRISRTAPTADNEINQRTEHLQDPRAPAVLWAA